MGFPYGLLVASGMCDSFRSSSEQAQGVPPCAFFQGRGRGKGLFCVLFAFCFFSGPASAAPDPDVQTLVQRLSPDSLRATVQRLSGFNTRFVGTDSSRAAGAWLRERLIQAGYAEARFDTFTVTLDRTILGRRYVLDRVPARNISVIKRGVRYPDRYLVLGSHYDPVNLTGSNTVSAPDTTFAPGANDNATGVAVVLEMARLLRAMDTDVSVVFILFDAAELGLWGSRAYAERARARGEDVRGMFSIDALGTRATDFPKAFSIDVTSRSLDLGGEVAQAALNYTSLIPRNTSGMGYLETISNRGREGCDCSDHQSFTDQGYPGVGVFQYFGADASFHTARDTVGAVDFALVNEIGRAAFAAATRIAGFPGRSPDFDGNGVVELSDFFLFATYFGTFRGEARFEARFDMDRDGAVGIEDFFQFAELFGRHY